jgi:isopentenyl-diphosphate delta-isomerase
MDAPRDPRVKLRHIEACLTQPVEYRKRTGLAQYDFLNEALPELALATLDLTATLAGKPLRAPLMIAPMTGGTARGLELNRRLAAVAEEFGLAFGVGSQRIALEREDCAAYFRVRDVAPTVPLFANFGAAQLARGYDAGAARRAVAMIGADALFVHFNAMQEAVKGGDLDFRDVARNLACLCRELAADGIPVFAREVCFGLTAATAARLVECGVAGIDCAGAGGTSWSKVEAYCASTPGGRALGLRFGEWGIPTSQSILNVRHAVPTLPLIACGGLRSGTDVAKAIALGADIGAMARPFLVHAEQGIDSLRAFVAEILGDLRICLFATGSASVVELRGKLVHVADPVPNAGDEVTG